jgi:hypothetical protein
VLLNPEGKGLVITHPEDALFVWKQHKAHQTDSDSAQISTTALMNKLMTLKIADSPTRHSFLVSFQEVCNRYDQLADVRLADSFKRTLLQASIMQDTALLNSWNTINEVKRAMNPNAPAATYTEFYTFLANKLRHMILLFLSKEAHVMLIKQTSIHLVTATVNAMMMKTVC